jgi:hypothetical protein
MSARRRPRWVCSPISQAGREVLLRRRVGFQASHFGAASERGGGNHAAGLLALALSLALTLSLSLSFSLSLSLSLSLWRPLSLSLSLSLARCRCQRRGAGRFHWR